MEIGIFSERLKCVSQGRGSSLPSSRGSDPSILGRDLRKPFDAHFQPFAYYITTSRQVNWKRIDLAVKACMMAQRYLIVIGEGPEHKKLVKMAEGSKHIKFLKVMNKEKLAEYLADAKGYLFPSLEPFGIAPVEALAAGCPVIAYGQGGARDYIREGKNGIFFDEQTAKSLAEAILKFETKKFDRGKVKKSVDGFDTKRFDEELRAVIKKVSE